MAYLDFSGGTLHKSKKKTRFSIRGKKGLKNVKGRAGGEI